MIEITVEARKITIKGHANFAEPGKDIVCAAISTLFQTFIKSVEELSMYDEIKTEIQPGNSFVELLDPVTYCETVLLRSFVIGCQMVAEAYPDNVSISCKPKH